MSFLVKHLFVQWEGGCAQHGAFIGVALSRWALPVLAGILEAGIAKNCFSSSKCGRGNLPWCDTLR